MADHISKRLRSTGLKSLTIIMIIIAVAGKWYSYVAFADTPFDDIGSEINALMPGPIKQYGCNRLRERFGKIPIPPRGCDVAGGWR